jgi:hypothetical protein
MYTPSRHFSKPCTRDFGNLPIRLLRPFHHPFQLRAYLYLGPEKLDQYTLRLPLVI